MNQNIGYSASEIQMQLNPACCWLLCVLEKSTTHTAAHHTPQQGAAEEETLFSICNKSTHCLLTVWLYRRERINKGLLYHTAT
jgi:hypothetical protein